MNAVRRALFESWPLLVLLLAAAIWFYRSPYSASDLEIVPDSEEYAIGAMELLETGHYCITIEGRNLPPRYAPWFSALAILPAYVAFGRDVGNAVVPVMAFSIAGVGCAWAIGRRITGNAGGICAGVAVLALPPYSGLANHIMTDVPCTALMLATCLVYLRCRARPESMIPYLIAGTLIALATLFRNLFLVMLFPCLLAAVKSRRAWFPRLLALTIPLGLATIATLAYNAVTFGSPLRNGYDYWVAVPYDYLGMTFSSSSIKPNLMVLLNSSLVILLPIALGTWLFLRLRESEVLTRSREPLCGAVIFFVLTAVPISTIHLLYFYSDERFYLPLLAGTALLAGALFAATMGRRANAVTTLLIPVILLLAIVGRITNPDAMPSRRLAAERIRASTENNAIVISTIDSLYFEWLAARGSQRRIVPLSRNVEYASKVLVPKRIPQPQPPPRNWRDHRAPGLLRGGAEEAVNFVAVERIDALVDGIVRGTPVYIDVTAADTSDNAFIGQLSQRFAFLSRAPYLYQLALR